MKFAELIKDMKVLYISGDSSIEITGIDYDSRRVEKGNLFVCIDGKTTDGHNYIKQAMGNGAAAFVTQKNIQLPEACTIAVTEDTRTALAFLSDKFFGHPSKSFKLVGVTGTKGKTTVTFMLKAIFDAWGSRAAIIGTLGTQIGNRKVYSERTTPESTDLQRLFKQMSGDRVETVAMEVSSQGLALHRVDFSDFDIGIFTNLSRDHIGGKEHANMEEYLKAKCMLFKMCRHGVINADSEYASRVLNEAECKILTFGIEKRADIRARNIIKQPQSVAFDLESPWYNGRFYTCIPGRFSVYNSLGAIGACGLLGISEKAVRKGLEAVRVPGRAELVETGRPFSVIIDYAHTPDSLENILSTIKEYSSGRVICVFGCGGDRDAAKRPMMGAISGKLADYTVITSDNPRTEDPEAIIQQIEEGIKGSCGQYISIGDRREAIKHSISIAQQGDVVVLAGKGHETYQILSDRTIHFDEREVVKELLEELFEKKCI